MKKIENAKYRVSFNLPFADFDYLTPLPKYNLSGHQRSSLELVVVGYPADIEKFESDFEGIVRA